jgi:BirA family transcriptional regulator, biotin operon repressor / biotin---[acetyl-CoA-carboxylase] ligase
VDAVTAPSAPSLRRLTFTLLRDLSHAHFTSGSALAEKYGVSRSAISDALKDANQLGIRIFSLTRRGYRLAAPLEFLDLDEIRAQLRAQTNRLNLSIVDSIDSTNTALLQQAALGAPSGTCLAAELQTAGRGRRGRVWQSALGASLTFSLLWRFEKGAAALGGLSLAVGLAVVNALQELGLEAKLKWPNDILANEKKLGGILIETQGDMLGPTVAVIGIGINIQLPEAIKESIDQPVTDVTDAMAERQKFMMSRNALLGATLRHLVQILDQFAETGFAPMREMWRARNAFEGQTVNVISPSETFTAKVVDVGADGTLIVDRGAGCIAITAAEISVRLPAK